MTPVALTDDEMEALIGTPVARLQVAWLDEQRWTYVLNRKGRPRVARAYAEQRLGVTAANDASVHTTQPDWGAAG
jgi:hypothetical protein